MPAAPGWVRSSLVAIASLAAASSAAADPPGREPIQLRYRAPAVCPGEEAMLAAVRARAKVAEIGSAPRAIPASAVPVPSAPAPAPAPVIVLDYTITAGPEGFLGTLVFHGSEEVSSRQLSASRCEDLVAALALVGALAIERDPSAARPPALQTIAPPPPEVETRRAFARALGGGGLASGMGPGAMWLAGLEAQLGQTGLGGIALAGSLGRDRDQLDAGAVVFTYASARLSACWTPFDRARFEADACGHFEAGGLRASGRQVVNAQEVNRLWLAAGAHAGIRRSFTAEAPGLFAELQVGASLPLLRDRFYFQPNMLIYQAPTVTPWVTLGAGYRFR